MQATQRKARSTLGLGRQHSVASSRPCVGRHCINLARRRGAGVCRFKGDDSVREEIERRRHQEELIRKQEELISMLSQPPEEEQASPEPPQSVDDLRKKLLQKPQRLDMVSRIIKHIHKGYDPSAFRCNLLVPAFTRRREAFVGRIAMLGFAGACIGEIITTSHEGIIGQIQLWSGLDKPAIVGIVAAIVAFNVIGGLNPWSPTWSAENVQDIARRPRGPPNTWVSPLNIRRFFGMSEKLGFTKRNELFHSRLAMIGFMAAFLGEITTGRGPLAQLAVWLNVLPTDEYYQAVPYVFGLFVATMIYLAFSDDTTRAAQQAEMEYELF